MIERIPDYVLADIEERPLSTDVARLLVALRDAYHDLDNPNYRFCNGRVTREAIVARNAEIATLRQEIKALKEAAAVTVDKVDTP